MKIVIAGISRGQARRRSKSGRLPAVRRWLRWWVAPVEVKRMLEDRWEIRTQDVETSSVGELCVESVG